MGIKTGRPQLISDRLRFSLHVGSAFVVSFLIGLALAYPTPPMALAPLPKVLAAGKPMGLFPMLKIHDASVEIADPMGETKRIVLQDAESFNRISKIHEVLSRFHSGLSPWDEESLAEHIYHESLRNGYDPELIVSVIMTESSFYKWARSHKGAIGMMQLLPVTGNELAQINRIPLSSSDALFDPHLNIMLGTQYLALLHKRFGDLGLALAAYNHGPNRVEGFLVRGEDLPTAYMRKVLGRYKELLLERSAETEPPSENITG